jgi:hypothetical protein
MIPRRAAGALAAAMAGAAAMSCGGGSASAKLAGESQHFRLFLGTMLGLTVDPQDELTRLETNRADTATLLRMPEGKVDYVLLRPDQIQAACGNPEAAGCEIHRTVYSSTLVDQHELNHAYLELRTPHLPHPLLVEGIAEAVGCGEGTEPPALFDQVPPWREVIAYASYGDVYGPGRQLARHLLLTSGGEAFLSYYAQAPRTFDPDLFASNFRGFWGVDLDAVWSAMQTAQPPWGPQEVLPLCPCSLPPWSAPAVPVALPEQPSSPYWTWPPLAGQTGVLAGYQGSFAVRDCARRDLQELSGFTVLFARLQGPLYAAAGSAVRIASGAYVSDACAGALAYDLPLAPVLANSGGSPIGIAVDRPAGTALSAYVALTTPGPIALGKYDGAGSAVVCASCSTADAACQPLPAYPSSVQVAGRFYVHWTEAADSASSGWPYTFLSLWVSPGS